MMSDKLVVILFLVLLAVILIDAWLLVGRR